MCERYDRTVVLRSSPFLPSVLSRVDRLCMGARWERTVIYESHEGNSDRKSERE